MQTIGLIGGMSWESTLEYYRIINEKVKQKLGGLHSAKIILFSVDFDEIEKLQHDEKWAELTEIMTNAAQCLELAGVNMIAICTNTMHKMADEVQANISVPLIHIADATAEVIQKQGIVKVGLLGTKFTMEQDFYTQRLCEKYSIEVIIPDEADRQIIHDVIYNELCLGEVKASSKKEFLRIIETLTSNGAQSIVLGCTEIPLLIKQEDISVPVFDTATIHAENIVTQAIFRGSLK